MKYVLTLFIGLTFFSCSDTSEKITKTNPYSGVESRKDSLIWIRDHADSDSLKVEADIAILDYLGCENADSNEVFINDIEGIVQKTNLSYAKGMLLYQKGENSLCLLHNDSAKFYFDASLNYFKSVGMHDQVLDSYNKILSTYKLNRSLDTMVLYQESLLEYSKMFDLDFGIVDYYTSKANLAAFESKFKEAIDISKHTLKMAEEIEYFEAIVNLNTQIGSSYKKIGKTDSSLYFLYRALNVCLESEFIGSENASSLVMNSIGTTYYRLGKLDSCIYYFDKALAIVEKLDIKEGIGSLSNNLGILSKMQGNQTKAIQYYRKAANIQERIGNKPGLATALTNIGALNKDLENYTSALRYYFQALAIYVDINSTEKVGVVKSNIGTTYERMGKLDSAMIFYKQAYQIQSEVNYINGMAIASANIGSRYLDMGEKDSAEYYLMNSYHLFKGSKNKEKVGSLLNSLSEFEMKRNNYSKAKKYADESNLILTKLNYPHLLKSNANALFLINYKLNNYKVAISHLKDFYRLNDTLLSEANKKSMVKFDLQREYDQKTFKDSVHAHNDKKVTNAQIAKQEAQIKTDKITRYALFGGLFLVLAIAGISFRAFKLKKRDHLIIQKQKSEVENQKLLVEEKNHEIMDSINYAKRLQDAILPDPELFDQLFKEAFVMYLPKDIVAGDFYWLEEDSEQVFFAVADCTGHGVPGAMVSVVCANALHKAVIEENIKQPSKILDRTRELVINTFEKRNKSSETQDTIKDGMDIALCSLTKDLILNYAGAYNPLWIIRNGELIETKATKQPIGQYENSTPFTNNKIQLEKGDTLYLFSDGFSDQFGGEKGKKFKSGNFKKLLLSLQSQNLSQQHETLTESITTWRGDIEQIDDVCIMGIKV